MAGEHDVIADTQACHDDLFMHGCAFSDSNPQEFELSTHPATPKSVISRFASNPGKVKFTVLHA